MMATPMANVCEEYQPLPLGLSLDQSATEAIQAFLRVIGQDFKYLEEILEEAKSHFGR